jgi:hypothetical protein
VAGQQALGEVELERVEHHHDLHGRLELQPPGLAHAEVRGQRVGHPAEGAVGDMRGLERDDGGRPEQVASGLAQDEVLEPGGQQEQAQRAVHAEGRYSVNSA